MIHVYENLYIDIDPCQYILREDTRTKLKTKTREYVKWRDLGYYGTLPAAIHAAVEELIRRKLKKKTYELSEAITIIKEEHRRLTKIINEKLKY